MIAAGEYRLRAEKARAMVAAGTLRQTQADDLLRPWLAIALLCDAPLSPALAEIVEEARECLIWGADGGPLRYGYRGSEHQARIDCARELCPDGEWRGVLGAARDAAILRAHNSADAALQRRAFDLICLARAFDVPLTAASCGAPLSQPQRNSA